MDLAVLHERAGEAARGEGDLAIALSHFQDSLDLHRGLVETNPTGAEEDAALHLGNVAASLEQVGDLLLVLGDVAGARSHFEESLAILRRLGEDLSMNRDRIASVRIAERNLVVARRRYEQDLRRLRRLAAVDADSQNHQRDIAGTLDNVGDTLLAQGRFARARARFEESLAIRRRLAGADPGSPDLQRDVAESLGRAGHVSARAGDKQAARRAGEEELAIAERMARADPGDPNWVRLQALAHARIARLGEADRSSRWRQVRDLLERLDAQGRLAPPDRGLLYEARENAPRAADR